MIIYIFENPIFLSLKLSGVGISPLAESDPTVHEEEPKEIAVGISVKSLTKIYDKVYIIHIIQLSFWSPF